MMDGPLQVDGLAKAAGQDDPLQVVDGQPTPSKRVM